MRAGATIPGMDYKRMVIVDLQPGEQVAQHQHTEETILYYPKAASPVIVTPVEGMIIYLPAETPHEVPKVTEDRLSVAMLIEPG